MTERRLLYIDPWMGVSGDMLMAALLDLDRSGSHLESTLREVLAAVRLDPSILSISREVDQGLACTAVRVREEDNPPLRRLSDLTGILQGSRLPEKVRERSRTAFERLARVEAGVHGCSVDEIHFHEVGAVDTIVDVVGVFALIEALGVDDVGVGTIPLGGGTVNIAHGEMGVPAPATAALLTGYPVVGGPEMHELTTPTGALLVSELKAEAGPMPAMAVDGIGYGCGTARFRSGPNVVRVMLGRAAGGAVGVGGVSQEIVVEMETNLDNISPEVIGHACRVLREAGALEVWTSPAFMKKDRPGAVLHVLALPSMEEALSDKIIAETGSLGVRRHLKQRRIAERGTVTVVIEGADIIVKFGRHRGRVTSVAAEYDSAVSAAAVTGLPLKDLMSRAVEEARNMIEAGRLV